MSRGGLIKERQEKKTKDKNVTTEDNVMVCLAKECW